MSESSHRVQSISPIFLKAGVPYSACGCILDLQSVVFHFWGHCYLDLDLSPQFQDCIVLSISPIFFDVGIAYFVFGCILVLLIASFYFLGHCDLDL